MTSAVPILMYHAVESAPRPPQYKHFYVLADEFAGQMRGLKRAGFTALTFQDFADVRAGTRPMPPKPVVLTFDDGYANLLTNVHPLLRELGFAYTVFLVSGKIGGTNDWVAAEGYAPTALLDWAQIREMQAEGVEFQPHTITHRHLTRLSRAEARQEMAAAKNALEQALQKAMDVLCYPYGDCNDTVVRDAADLGYRMGVTTEFGRARADDDPLRLPRISVYHVPPVSLTYGVGTLNFWWRLRSRKDARPAAVPALETR